MSITSFKSFATYHTIEHFSKAIQTLIFFFLLNFFKVTFWNVLFKTNLNFSFIFVCVFALVLQDFWKNVVRIPTETTSNLKRQILEEKVVCLKCWESLFSFHTSLTIKKRRTKKRGRSKVEGVIFKKSSSLTVVKSWELHNFLQLSRK